MDPDWAEAGDALLMTSTDGRRLYWRTPEGALWVYDEAADAASLVAEEIAATPRPYAQVGGGLCFWRTVCTGSCSGRARVQRRRR